MHSVTDTYKTIVDSLDFATDVKLNINGVDYGMDKIISMSTTSKAFADDTVEVGSTYSGTIDVKLLTPSESIPRMATLKPYVRVRSVDGTVVDDAWHQKGAFYIDTRSYDEESGILTISGYDAMLKAEAVAFNKASEMTVHQARYLVAVFATMMGCEQISANLQLIPLTEIPYVEDYTIRQYLHDIGVISGGNFIIDDFNNLKLIRLNNLPSAPGVVINESNYGIIFGGYNILVEDSTSNPVPDDYVSIGFNYTKSETDKPFTSFNSVVIDNGTDEAISSGSGERVLRAYCETCTQDSADSLLNIIRGYSYQPMTIEGARVHPAVEIGDGIKCSYGYSGVFNMDITFDTSYIADISAPFENEIDHEYPYQNSNSSISRRLNSKISSMGRTLEAEIQRATQAITGNDGGYVVIHDANDDGKPDEILIMNTPDINTATQVWRWNKNGLGFAKSYNSSEYANAFTVDSDGNGYLVADFITGGTLSANRIHGGMISSFNDTEHTDYTSLDMESGVLKIYRKQTSKDYDIYLRLSGASLSAWKVNRSTGAETMMGAYGFDSNGETILYADGIGSKDYTLNKNSVLLRQDSNGHGYVKVYNNADTQRTIDELSADSNGNGQLIIRNADGTLKVKIGQSSSGNTGVWLGGTASSNCVAEYKSDGLHVYGARFG